MNDKISISRINSNNRNHHNLTYIKTKQFGFVDGISFSKMWDRGNSKIRILVERYRHDGIQNKRI